MRHLSTIALILVLLSDSVFSFLVGRVPIATSQARPVEVFGNRRELSVAHKKDALLVIKRSTKLFSETREKDYALFKVEQDIQGCEWLIEEINSHHKDALCLMAQKFDDMITNIEDIEYAQVSRITTESIHIELMYCDYREQQCVAVEIPIKYRQGECQDDECVISEFESLEEEILGNVHDHLEDHRPLHISSELTTPQERNNYVMAFKFEDPVLVSVAKVLASITNEGFKSDLRQMVLNHAALDGLTHEEILDVQIAEIHPRGMIMDIVVDRTNSGNGGLKVAVLFERTCEGVDDMKREIAKICQ
eukprot:CAMPEP_0113934550 /NCGR_PEP_ID=MMETSP1339-20121228/1877_1 /TAXON_ID=94617 /ORGANISM="Fibrocapsa japonica" /LENGTH=305 /DNA_ID=CAMNT_0000936407 /DNA_START=53 /DNA_END=970 /DNA_ORIENTATION=+ /assembly_acc=CAM_ASM_000762